MHFSKQKICMWGASCTYIAIGRVQNPFIRRWDWATVQHSISFQNRVDWTTAAPTNIHSFPFLRVWVKKTVADRIEGFSSQLVLVSLCLAKTKRLLSSTSDKLVLLLWLSHQCPVLEADLLWDRKNGWPTLYLSLSLPAQYYASNWTRTACHLQTISLLLVDPHCL